MHNAFSPIRVYNVFAFPLDIYKKSATPFVEVWRFFCYDDLAISDVMYGRATRKVMSIKMAGAACRSCRRSDTWTSGRPLNTYVFGAITG